MATGKAYYTAPGVQIEKIFRNVSNTSTEIPRGVCIIGSGETFKYQMAEAIIRGYVKGESLTFSGSSPWLATLSRDSNEDKGDSIIFWVDENGNNHNLSDVDWDFSSANQIYVKDNVYKQNRQYRISYQSTATDSTDELINNNVFQLLTVGDNANSTNYKIGEDVYLKTIIQGVEPKSSNSGDGIIQIAGTSYYTKFEERTYTIKITATGAALSDVKFSWWGNTQSSGSDVNVTADAAVTLEDGVTINFISASTEYSVNDEYSFIVDSMDVISWDKTTSVVESIIGTNLFQDVNGTITGNVGNWYTRLDNVPNTISSIIDLDSSTDITADCAQVGATAYLDIGNHHPANGISVSYVHTGNEPQIGAIYYVNYYYERPDSDYFSAKLAFELEKVVDDVGGITADNQIAMAAQIAFENNAPYIFYIQIKDQDNDGVYSFIDYQKGIDASEEKDGITDVIALNSSNQVRSYLQASITAMSSPTGMKERIGWYGMPIGTPIGDVNTPGTYVYTSKKVLREYGNSAGRGRSILLAPPKVKKTFLLKDGSEEQFVLDSNYLAVATAARLDSFASPSEALLRKQIVGFDEIQLYTNKEREALAAAGCMVLESREGTYIVFDDTTTDTTSDDVMIPSAIVQQDFVTKLLRNYLDVKIVGYVPRSANEGIALIRSAIALKLRQCVNSEVIAPFGDNEDRDIQPLTDIYVERDPVSKTAYNFKYWFNIRYPIKRLFGQYTVDQDFQPIK